MNFRKGAFLPQIKEPRMNCLFQQLKTLQEMIKNHPAENCDELKLEFMLRDLMEFATCLSYSIYKLESVLQLSKYATTKKRHNKLEAINQINLANEIWIERWQSTNGKDVSSTSFRPYWNNERKRDLEVIKKFRN